MHDIGGAVDLTGIGRHASQGVGQGDDRLIAGVRDETAVAEGIACSADQRSGCDVAASDLLQRQRRGDAVVAVEGIAAEGRLHIRIGAARVVPGPRAVAAVGDVLREVRPGIVVDVQRRAPGSCPAAGIRHLGRDGDRTGLIQYTRRQGGGTGAADAGAGLDAVRLDRRSVGAGRAVDRDPRQGFAVDVQPPAVERGIAVDRGRAYGGYGGDDACGDGDREGVGIGPQGIAAGVNGLQ